MLTVTKDQQDTPAAAQSSDSMLDEIVREGARRMLAAALEAEVVAYSAVDEIHIAWQAGQLLRSAFHQDTPAEGRRIAEHVIASFSSCPIPEIARLAGP